MRKFFRTTNAKEVGFLYLVRGIFRGVVGFQMSYLLRVRLKYSGLNFIGSSVVYQTILTAHAFVMIFFYYAFINWSFRESFITFNSE